MNQPYIRQKGYKPMGEIYRFKEEELQQIFIDFVKEQTGLELKLQLGCLNEAYDVYVRWDIDDYEDIDDAFTPEEWERINKVGLSTEEEFVNRDLLLSQVFGSDFASVTIDFESEEYEVFVPYPSEEK
jgi:hypothetical protein